MKSKIRKFLENLGQVSDDEVIRILKEARGVIKEAKHNANSNNTAESKIIYFKV